MHIKTVTHQNFKGRNRVAKLGPASVIIGENFTGKTAIVDAVRLALLGYSPAHGKSAGACWGFAGSDTAMSVAVEFDTGAAVGRSWEWRRNKVTTKDPIVSGIELEKIAPCMLDVRDYLNKSGPERVRYVFNQVKIDDKFTADAITAAIKNGCKVETSTADTEAAIGDAVAQVEELDRAAQETGQSVQELVESIIASFKDKADTAKKALERNAGLIQGTAAMQAKETATPVDLSEEMAAARAKISNAESRLAVAQERARLIIERDRKISAARKTIADAAAAEAQIKELATRRAAIDTTFRGSMVTVRTSEVRIALEVLASAETAVRQIRERQKQRQAAIDTARATLASTQRRDLEQAKAEAKGQVQKLQAEIEALKPTTTEAAAAELQKEINECSEIFHRLDKAAAEAELAWANATKPSWVKTVCLCKECAKKVDRHFAPGAEAAETNLAEARRLAEDALAAWRQASDRASAFRVRQAQLHETYEKLDDAKVTLNEAERFAQVAGVLAELETAEKSDVQELSHAERVVAERDVLHRQAVEALEAARAEDTEATGRHNAAAKLDKELGELRQRTAAADAARQEIDTLTAQGLASGDPGPIEAELERLRNELAGLEERQKLFTAHQADRRRVAEAQEEAARHEAERTIYTLAAKAVLAMQKDEVDKAFVAFMDGANEFARDILPGKLEFRAGDIGYFASGSWVALDYFSGTEELIAFAGLSVALATTSPFRLVIMDELGRLTKPLRTKLVERMGELIKRGVIDQFIGLDALAASEPTPYALSAVEVVRL